jgi:chromosome segregation ATPase
MSTLAFEEAQIPLAADDFNALEQRVLRMVELLKHERETRTAAEHRVQTLENTVRSLEESGLNSEQRAENLEEKLMAAEQKIQELTTLSTQNTEQIQTLEGERETVRGRVERLLKHLDEIPA